MSTSCWILTDGRTGTENNARGLAEALGLSPEVKRVELRQPWKTLSPWLRLGLRYAFTLPLEPAPSPALPRVSGRGSNWPDLLITAGRTPAVGSLYVGQQSPATLRIHITNPGISARHFNLVIAPQHDGLSGPHILTTTGALHRVTPEKLAEAKALWEPRFAHLPRPWHGVLVGGDAHGLRLDASTAQSFMQEITALGGSTLVTASRRTGPDARTELSRLATYMWDGSGDNPYLGILACVDALYVTADSVSMLSEAASSGKPAYLLSLPGHAAKLERCHKALLEGGHIARFTGMPPTPTTRLDDMSKAVAAVRELLLAHRALSH